MLLWETLNARPAFEETGGTTPSNLAGGNRRLPFETRCVAATKSGRRCKGRSHQGADYCVFHDPSLADQRRQRLAAARAARRRKRLTHLPDGYLGQLTNRRAVGQAMDRLYREIRLEKMTVEMGKVLFSVLARLMDSGVCNEGRDGADAWRYTKAKRIRPKLSDLLTRAEQQAWHRAQEKAPVAFLHAPPQGTGRLLPAGESLPPTASQTILTAAS